jgi:hypothetical protein
MKNKDSEFYCLLSRTYKAWNILNINLSIIIISIIIIAL